MTVDESTVRDKFPVGMRVLAVDDDPTCLKLLERLLRHCQYHVTTTNEAITALKMLRENKDKFDLVISDVHMPDMDGFKLLELVGLEMDLPVIMLSANSDTKAVMKGITHGACDYLLKPVRIEELKNIWQHVVRRRKFDSKDHINNDNMDSCEKPLQSISEGAQGPITNGASDRNGKINKKRKDEEDDDDCDNDDETEDSSAQKKPRVVWSVELHRKFVAAVNHLGIDKAVPKRILDLMNVERLTRENVASHLQKYRLYLKRISVVASQQANIVAALGGRDSSYLRMGPFDGLGNYHSLAGSRQLPSVASYQPAGVIGRLNIPNGLGLHGLASSGMIQLGHTHNAANTSVHDLGKLQCIKLPGNRHGNLLQGMPTSLELDQLQQHNSVRETNNPLPGVFFDTRLPTGNSSNSFLNVTNSSLMLQANDQQAQSSGLCNQSSVTAMTLSQDPFQISSAVSSHLPDLGRCNDTWQDASQLTGYSANNLSVSAPFSHDNLSCNTLREIVPPITTHMESNPHDASLRSAVEAPLHDLGIGRDLQPSANSLGENILLMPMGTSETSKFSLIGCVSNSQQTLEEPKQDPTRKSNLFSSTLTSTLPNCSIINPICQNLGQNNGLCNRKIDVAMMNQSNFGAPFFTQRNLPVKSTDDGQLKFKDDYFLEPSKLPDGLSSNGYSSFDDLMNAVIKREHDDATFMDGDMGCDIFPLETCM